MEINLSNWDVHTSEESAVVQIDSVQNITLYNVSIMDNTAGSGLLLIDSNVYFKGDKLFYNNSALAGAAIGLYDSSVIVILSPAKLNSPTTELTL